MPVPLSFFREFELPPAQDESTLDDAASHVVAVVHGDLKASPRPGRVTLPMRREVFVALFSLCGALSEVPDSRGFYSVNLDVLASSRRSFAMDRLVWLDKFGEGRVVDDLRVRHHVRRQGAGFEWDAENKRGVEKSPHLIEELIVMFLKKVYAES